LLELLLSRSVLGITGVFIVAIASGAILSLESAHIATQLQGTAEKIASKLTELASMEGPGKGILEVSDYVPCDGWIVECRSGLVTVAHGPTSAHASIGGSAIEDDGGFRAAANDRIVLLRTVVDGKLRVAIYAEKVDAISFTASMKVRQSAGVL
jgi:hypothetical protein